MILQGSSFFNMEKLPMGAYVCPHHIAVVLIHNRYDSQATQ